jgi:hypothetical protein
MHRFEAAVRSAEGLADGTIASVRLSVVGVGDNAG